jgi:hypothetical protein
MAEVKNPPRPVVKRRSGRSHRTASEPAGSFDTRLRKAILKGLGQAGIDAKVETEPVPTTKLHRVLITARQFKQLRPSERQDLVWRIVGASFAPDEQLRISMIITLTPDEFAGR